MELVRSLYGACKELVTKLVKFCTKLHTQEYLCIKRNDLVLFRYKFQNKTCTELVRSLYGACVELVAKLNKFCTKLHTQQISTNK
jgi:hypothetical protein